MNQEGITQLSVTKSDVGLQASIERLLREAQTAHERGLLDNAQRDYQAILGLDEDHAEALHRLGVLNFQQGRLADADRLLRRSIDRMPSPLALANHASVLVSLGNRDEALESLNAALEINPSHLRTHYLRAGMLFELGRYGDAVDDFDHVLASTPAQVDVLWKRAAALHALGQMEEALESCDRALAVEGKSFEALAHRGHILRDLRRFDEAIAAYAHALAIVPDSHALMLQMGRVLLRVKRVEEALASFNDVIAAQPDHVDALFGSSVALERLGRYQQALARCERVLLLRPKHAGALANRGGALYGLERDVEALDSYNQALEVEPRSCEVLCNLAKVLDRLERPDEALASCERAIAVDDAFLLAWVGRGRILQVLQRYDDALACFDRALSITPADTNARLQRGNTLRQMGRHTEALAEYDRVLDAHPGELGAHFSKAFELLTLGDFERGWPEYEWRWREAQVGKSRRTFVQPLWLGEESVAGKTVLLHAEQGLGDTVQFCRYASLVKARGATVILEVQPALKSLLAGLADVDQVVGTGEPLPPFDMHCPLLSLALAFKTDGTSIPSDIPYVHADPTLVGKWAKRLGNRRRPRIGIVWSGNPKHLGDYARSIPFANLSPLLTDAFDWISLQKIVRERDRPALEASAVMHLGEEIFDFRDTAALVASMDLVISVDTSVAHLVGALGRPLWLLLPYMPDWRWLLDREDSAWYPSAKLFRQAGVGDWTNVLDRVSNELSSISTSFSTDSVE